MAQELEKSYNPSSFEDRIYDFWMKGNYFHAEADPDKKPYTIVMPPPNITGQLHMGHALDNTMQDILIRWKRMQGFNTLWQPGTDHAAIATEVKVIQKIIADGHTKEELGRRAASNLLRMIENPSFDGNCLFDAEPVLRDSVRKIGSGEE